MGSLFSKNSTSTTSSTPSTQALSAYKGIANILTQAAARPLRQYAGPRVAGFTPDQQAGFQQVQAAQGSYQPYLNAASQYAAQGAAPITNIPQVGTRGVNYQAYSPEQFSSQGIAQFYNPYQQNVIDTTMANINRNNAIQQNQLVGNAIQSGASPFGGDRAGVAAAELARNQALASNQTMADISSQGYTQALQAFQNQQGMNTQAGLQNAGNALQASGQNAANTLAASGQNASNYLNTAEANAARAAAAAGQFAGFGNQAQQQQLAGASALLQTGGLQQQLAQNQLDIPYQNFVQQQQYPQQQAQWLASLLQGSQPNLGNTTSSVQPGPGLLSQGIGAAASLYGLGGLQKRGGVVDGFADGGTPEPPNDDASNAGGQGWVTLPTPGATQAPAAGIGSFSYLPAAGYSGINIPQMGAPAAMPAAQSYPDAYGRNSYKYPDYLNALPQIRPNVARRPITTNYPALFKLMRAFPGLIKADTAVPKAGIGSAEGGAIHANTGFSAMGDTKVTQDPPRGLPGVPDIVSSAVPRPAGSITALPQETPPEASAASLDLPAEINVRNGHQWVDSKNAKGDITESIKGLPDPNRSGTKWDQFLGSPRGAVFQGGLAMMAGESPYPLVNIGKGLAAGVAAAQEARKSATANALAQQRMAFEQAQAARADALAQQQIAMQRQQMQLGAVEILQPPGGTIKMFNKLDGTVKDTGVPVSPDIKVTNDAAGNPIAVVPTGNPQQPFKTIDLLGQAGNPFSGAGATPAGGGASGAPVRSVGPDSPPALAAPSGGGPASPPSAPLSADDQAKYAQKWQMLSRIKPSPEIDQYKVFLQQQAAAGVPADQVPSIDNFIRSIKPPLIQNVGETELAKVQTKGIGEAIDAGKDARKTLQYANVMQDALNRGGDNIWTGPGSGQVRTFKSLIANLTGENVEGLPETDIMAKGGILLATQATKALSSRPSQFEFQKNIEASPGIAMSKQGSQLMLSIVRQQAQADLDLSRLAAHVKDPAQWPDIVDKYYKDHPFMSPWDPSKPLTDDDVSQHIGIAVGKSKNRPTPAAIKALRDNPSKAQEFDDYYGAGAAAKALGQMPAPVVKPRSSLETYGSRGVG